MYKMYKNAKRGQQTYLKSTPTRLSELAFKKLNYYNNYYTYYTNLVSQFLQLYL